nr:ATP-binding protein [Propylenella binzhouense]
MRARLRGRPDTEHEMMLNRLVISFLILVYLTVSLLSGHAGAVEPLAFTSFYCFFSLALMIHMLGWPGICVPRRLVAIVSDLGILSYGMHAGGDVTAMLYPVYLWVIFGNGFRFGVPYLLVGTAAGVAGFGLVIQTTPYWRDHFALSLGLLAGLVILPLYAATLIRKLERARATAEQASRAKSMFLASVSHELRTPLNAIIGMGDLLGRTELDEEQYDMIRTVRTSAGSLLALINELLDYSRLEAGKMPVHEAAFNLHRSLGEVKAMVAAQAQAKGLHLGLHISAAVPPSVIGDERHLKEILLNLAGNAVKFTDRGSVTIAVGMVGEAEGRARLRFEVSDTGIGIAPEAKERIFESFSQADETIINRYGGTGLGLAIVRQLVGLMGGEIGVESRLGEGSTFWVSGEFRVGEAAPSAPMAAGLPVVLLAASPRRAEELRDALAALDVHPAGARTAPEAVAAVARLDGAQAGRIAIILDPADLRSDLLDTLALLAGQAGGRARVILVGEADHGGLPEPELRRHTVSMVEMPVRPRDLAAALRIAAERDGEEEVDPVGLQLVARRPLHVLIAEDNRTNQKVLSKILERAGHRSRIAENGEAALDILAEDTFDVVLMDVNMPVLDGIEATKLYRFASIGQRRVPILGLTADASQEARERCMEAGMDDCASKPIDPRQLLTLIDAVVPEDASAAPQIDRAGDTVTSISSHPRFKPSHHPAIDLGALGDLEALGGKDFVEEVVEEFLRDAARILEQLDSAVRDRDVAAFRDQAHALRSASANIGAQGMYQLCLSWRELPYDDLVRDGAAQIERLRSEFDRVRFALDARPPETRLRGPA